MAGGSLLMLLDDIASILDDVAVMTKTAASKTAGVLGDDLALNAQQVSGVVAKRELPVVWGVAKGSFVNKLILVPSALVGGIYLSYEGVEKLAHRFLHPKEKSVEAAAAELAALKAGEVDEAGKIKGAIRTDFVLSAEIIAITLGVVAAKPLTTQALTLSAIAVLMTVGVYGLVACIVKLDDLGLYLSQRRTATAQGTGRAILWAAPFLMKLLSVLGTAAMFLVGGGILTHGIHAVHEWIARFAGSLGGVAAKVVPVLLDGVFGMLAGAVALGVMMVVGKVRGKGH
jgi:predicted DNA repair protein MutK